jgi:hypothetical protein
VPKSYPLPMGMKAKCMCLHYTRTYIRPYYTILASLLEEFNFQSALSGAAPKQASGPSRPHKVAQFEA